MPTVSPMLQLRAEGLMTAAVVAAPGRINLTRHPIPEPGPGDVRIRLEGCGVCASNVPPFEGRPWFTYPMSPGQLGHEGWGRIDAIGQGVSNLREGDRVAFLSNNAFAEYDVAPAHAVVKLPATLDDRPFPGEPLACAMNIFERSAIEPRQTVAVVGVGFLGALLTQLITRAKAHVIAISRRATALEVARQMGARDTIALADAQHVVDEVKQLTHGAMCPRVIEATGKQMPLDVASQLVRERGRLIIAGYHQDGLRQVDMQQWNWRGIDVINAHERDEHVYINGMRRAIAAVEQGQLTPEPLYTHTYRLDELPKAMRDTRERPNGFIKALVTMQSNASHPSLSSDISQRNFDQILGQQGGRP